MRETLLCLGYPILVEWNSRESIFRTVVQSRYNWHPLQYIHLIYARKRPPFAGLHQVLKTTSTADGLPALLLFHGILVKTLPALLHLKTHWGNQEKLM